jgi:hypothetical protein
VKLRPLIGATVLVVLLAGACGDDDDSGDAAPAEGSVTETMGTTTEPLVFEGDPDSEFCQRSREAAEQPVLDPFEAGLEPREVELRFRALTQRFEGFAEIAPEPLADDLALLDETFQELAVVLEEADYDFAQLAADDVDVSAFDDPALAVVAERLAAYQAQVCAAG